MESESDNMMVFIASDHRGVEIKEELKKYLFDNGVNIHDIGMSNYDLDDYPDFAFKMGELINDNKDAIGILICGNGVGMSIAANKVKGIRCVRATDVDDAFKGKNHNGANVLAIGANLGIDLIKEIVDTFILTKPATEERYLKRINKIINYENGEYNEL